MSVQFLAPAAAPLESIKLKKPIFGDQHIVTMQVTVRHSRNGERYAYKRTPTYQTLRMEFHNIPLSNRSTCSSVDTIKTFFEKYAATDVLFVLTQNSRVTRWKGIIINDLEFTNEGKDGCSDLYSLNIEFEGAPY
jgi:hypothetical protein